jgi:HlyD family secretion protein
MSESMDRKLAKPAGLRRFAVPAAAIAACIGLGVLAANLLNTSAVHTARIPAAGVTIDTVQQGVLHDFTPLRGKVAPKDEIYLDALEGGQVERIMAHAGDQVTAGQPLIAFRNTALELDVLEREGRLVESITELQSYEKQLEDSRLANEKAAAEIDFNIVRLTRASARRSALVGRGAVSPEAEDQLNDELAYQRRLEPLQAQNNLRQDELRRRQLPEIHTQLANLQQSLVITRSKLDSLVLRAPVSGQLTDIVRNLGENRNRGDRLGEIVPATGFKVAAQVDEFYLGQVKVGQLADAGIDGATWKLKVERVYPQVKDGTFVVDLAFVGAEPANLLSGEAVIGTLSLGDDRPALILPAGAFLERTGGDWVMVAAPDGRSAVRRRIRIGRRNAEQVEILSGLAPGERVITSDYSAIDKVDRVILTR